MKFFPVLCIVHRIELGPQTQPKKLVMNTGCYYSNQVCWINNQLIWYPLGSPTREYMAEKTTTKAYDNAILCGNYIYWGQWQFHWQIWNANWAITGLCQNKHLTQRSFSLLAGFNLADFMMLGRSASIQSHSQTQIRRDTWKHSLVSANCPALLATVYCHHTAMECMLVSEVIHAQHTLGWPLD